MNPSTQVTMPESKLNQFYRAILPAVGYYADEDALVSWTFPGRDELDPVRIGNKRMVLATHNHLKNPDWSQRIVFNPLKQNITGGESVIMDKFRDRATTYMNFEIGYLVLSLARLACSQEKHKDLSPDEARYLTPLMDADAGFVDRIESIVAVSAASSEAHRGNREFCRFTLSKGRDWNGAKRQRVAGAHFRIYELIKSADFNRSIAGVSLRIKDVKMLTNLYEFIFPEITDIGCIEYGTDQMVAPSMVALMTVYKTVAERVNKVAADLQHCIPAASLLAIPVDTWASQLADLTDLIPDIDALPVFDGNNTKNKIATEQENSRIAQAAIDANAQIAAQTAQGPMHAATAPSLGYAAPQEHMPAYQQPVQGQPHPQSNQYSIHTPVATTAPAPVFTLGSPRPGAVLGSSPTAAPVAPSLPDSHSGGLRIVTLPSVTDDMEKRQREEQLKQALRIQQEALDRARNPAAYIQKLPEDSCTINGQLYVPASNDSNGVVPVGAIMHNGRLYVPYVANTQPQQIPGMMPGMTMPGMPGVQMNAQMMMASDPRTWPGISPELAALLAVNQPMKAQYIQTMMQSTQSGVQATQAASPHNQIPRYLQQTMDADRDAALAARNAQFGAIFGGGQLGGVQPGMVPGMGTNGMTPQQMQLLQQQLALQQQMLNAGMVPPNMQVGNGMQAPGSGMQVPNRSF